MIGLSIILYTIFTIPLLYITWKRHYLAFKEHALRQIILLLIFCFCLVVILKRQFEKISFDVCLEYFGDDVKEGGFCFRMVEKRLKVVQKEWTYLVMVELLPVASFLVLNYPHDCYRCFGKDPDRLFSQYQFTERELATR